MRKEKLFPKWQPIANFQCPFFIFSFYSDNKFLPFVPMLIQINLHTNFKGDK